MPWGSLLEELSPHGRVLTAVVPFAIAMFTRFVLGKSRVTGWLITLTTVWFAANVLLAPYSIGMRQGIREIGRMIP
jgi:hypothetical protein